MPSSFVDSIPPIMKYVIDASPARIADIGPGWGKYGLMCREYLPELVQLDAVEVAEGRLATQDEIYNQIVTSDVRLLPDSFWEGYDLVLIIDVIEHMTKQEGLDLLSNILNCGASVLISTPKEWMEQHDEHNPYETHVSHWKWRDFRPEADNPYHVVDLSTIDSIIYVLCQGAPETEQEASDEAGLDGSD